MKKDPVIVLKNVHKRLGAQEVLRGFDLELRRGETLVLLGRSGEGKSVSLRHIAGLMQADQGEVWIEQDELGALNERALNRVRIKLGLLFQNGALFDSFDVGQNVAFPLWESGQRDRPLIREKVLDALDAVGMVEHVKKWPVSLSGGQRKRVALARAIIMEPQIMLYDEPTAGLDPIATASIDHLITRVKNERRVSSLVITHDLASVRRIADRVLYLHEGQNYFCGPVDEFFDHTDPILRSFIEGRCPEADLITPPSHHPTLSS
jgi:phospholipid/cholesterol/gamma-HCH transport system ATP-binding protein